MILQQNRRFQHSFQLRRLSRELQTVDVNHIGTKRRDGPVKASRVIEETAVLQGGILNER